MPIVPSSSVTMLLALAQRREQLGQRRRAAPPKSTLAVQLEPVDAADVTSTLNSPGWRYSLPSASTCHASRRELSDDLGQSRRRDLQLSSRPKRS